jgi:hypothetical protein
MITDALLKEQNLRQQTIEKQLCVIGFIIAAMEVLQEKRISTQRLHQI